MRRNLGSSQTTLALMRKARDCDKVVLMPKAKPALSKPTSTRQPTAQILTFTGFRSR